MFAPDPRNLDSSPGLLYLRSVGGGVLIFLGVPSLGVEGYEWSFLVP